ncbi:MAG: outer membrane beta-barrel domain-containing protein [Myxococcaceae bacterium]|nr:outer membrane beta-barrel domain-containing protein [Myxococcaceae bacterium]
MKRLLAVLLLAVVFAPVAAVAQSDEEAGDVSEVDKDRLGPLRERVRPVSGNLFLKKGRFELSPSGTMSLDDAFFTKYAVGATIGFFPREDLGIHLRFGYAFPTVSHAAQICTTESTGAGTVRGCRPPTFEQLDGRAPGQITLIGGADVEYSPIYGKISLIAEKFLHFDLYGLLGASVVGYNGPNGGAGSKAYMSGGGNLGVGSRIILNRFLAVRAELRDLIYVESVAGTPSSSLRNQLLFELGLSVFLPTNFIAE